MNTEGMNFSFKIGWSRYGVALAAVCFAGGAAFAGFKVDRSVMSEAYWQIWNDEAQAKIDADIESTARRMRLRMSMYPMAR